VLKVLRDDGDKVRKGDVLAILENVSLDANAQRAAAELAKQEAETEKQRSLFAKGAISEKELADAEYLLKSAQTSALEAKHSFGETKLRAPFDGVVAAREVRVGETASGGQRAFQVVDLNRLRVVASLPERDMGRVRLGQTVRLVSAYDAERKGEGTVVRLSPIVDATSGTFRVTIALAPDQSVLRPGQFVEVNIEVDRRVDVLTVPRPAVVYEDGLPVVFHMVEPPPPEEKEASDEKEEAETSWWAKKDEDEDDDASELDIPKKSAKRMSIELGLVDDTSAEVLSGIAQGDLIVVIGQSNLKDGASIRTPEMLKEAEEKAAAEKDDKSEAKADVQEGAE
jgi:membrane fusion protein (multidrug efflux system)